MAQKKKRFSALSLLYFSLFNLLILFVVVTVIQKVQPIFSSPQAASCALGSTKCMGTCPFAEGCDGRYIYQCRRINKTQTRWVKIRDCHANGSAAWCDMWNGIASCAKG